MRKIEIIDAVKLRFPGRDTEFDLGIEVGALSVLMAQGVPAIDRQISHAAIEQLRPIAERFRYLLTVIEQEGDMAIVSFSLLPRKPHLRLVSC